MRSPPGLTDLWPAGIMETSGNPAAEETVLAVIRRIEKGIRKMAADSQTLKQAIVENLRKVIDPETGLDVMTMELVEDLKVDESGTASYTFRPSSPFCPLAFVLGQAIKKAVESTPGLSGQKIEVAGYIQPDKLLETLNE